MATLYETDDVTPALPVTFALTPAGSYSATVTKHLWVTPGASGVGERAIRLALEAKDATGNWVETGVPIADRQEVQVQVSGSANPGGDPAFPARSTSGWTPLGAGAWFSLGDVRGNCAVYLTFRYAPSLQGGSGTTASSWRIRVITGTTARALAVPMGQVGVLNGIGDPSSTEWNAAPSVTPDGTPSANVNIGARTWVNWGVAHTHASEVAVLNQNGASGTLASGQAYYAVISQDPAGTTVRVTKGTIAAAGSAVVPALPSGDLPIATVQVRYGASRSTITAGDITVLCSNGIATLGYSASSLTVTVGRLRAMLPTVFVESGALLSITLPASSNSTIYLTSVGALSLTAATTSLPLYQVTTNDRGVTGTPTDLRNFFSFLAPSFTGDVTSIGTVTTVAMVDGVAATTIAAAASTVATATDANTPSTMVKRDGSGNFSAGTITASLTGTASHATSADSATTASSATAAGDGVSSASGTAPLMLSLVSKALTGSVAEMGGATSGAAGTPGLVPAPAAGDEGKVLRGDKAWVTLPDTGGKTGTEIAAAVDAVAAATDADTFGTLVKRDGAGSVSVARVVAGETLVLPNGYDTQRSPDNAQQGHRIVVQEDIVLSTSALNTFGGYGAVLMSGAVIEMITLKVLTDVTGAAGPTQLIVGDGSNAARFCSGNGPLTAGSHFLCPDHLAASPWQNGWDTLQISTDNQADAGSVRITAYLRTYDF